MGWDVCPGLLQRGLLVTARLVSAAD